MSNKKWQSISLPREVIEQLRSMAHPGQSVSGVIQELIDKVKVLPHVE